MLLKNNKKNHSKVRLLKKNNIMSIFVSPCDPVTYSLMKKSQSLVDEREETKHSKYNNKNNEGKGGRAKFGAAQYKQFKNRTTVEESNSNHYKHKRNNSGAGDNLMP